jgi:cytidyltransferase-like protein
MYFFIHVALQKDIMMRKNKIITNGCFDMFHAGHKRLIRKCLELTNFGTLCIMVNSDRWIKEHKGKDRPIFPEEKRREELNNYITNWCCTNMEYPKVEIVFFDKEEELKEKINSFRPDILVKGHDYTDISGITGYGDVAILVLPRPENIEEQITTTKLANK